VSFDDGAAEVCPAGGRASRSGAVWWRDERLAVQVRPIQNGVTLAACRHACRRAGLTRARGGVGGADAGQGGADTSKVLLCPMPGLVKAIGQAQGRRSRPASSFAIVEAMKMENVLRAERDVTVKRSTRRRATASRSMR
jgi:propionyl-CoA carboxylase alpha chain